MPCWILSSIYVPIRKNFVTSKILVHLCHNSSDCVPDRYIPYTSMLETLSQTNSKYANFYGILPTDTKTLTIPECRRRLGIAMFLISLFSLLKIDQLVVETLVKGEFSDFC